MRDSKHERPQQQPPPAFGHPSPGPLTPDATIRAQVSKDRFSTEEIRRAYDLTPSMYRPRYNLLTICIYDVNAFFQGTGNIIHLTVP